VFFWEYFGPLLTYSFIYFFPQFVYFGYRCAHRHQISSVMWTAQKERSQAPLEAWHAAR